MRSKSKSSSSRSSSSRKSSRSGSSSRHISRTSLVTTNHDQIRRWAEQRDGEPACVRGTERGDSCLLRIDFPGYTGEKSLEHISWKEFFKTFDEQDLAMVYQDSTARGRKSNFNKLVARDTVMESGRGKSSRASGQSRGRSSERSGRKSGKGGAMREVECLEVERPSRARANTGRARSAGGGRAKSSGRRHGR